MNRIIAALMATLGLAAMTGAAAVPDFFDDFSGYAVGTGFTVASNGWQTPAGGIRVTNDAYHSAPQSVILPARTTLTNAVNGGGGKVIWTDLFLRPALGGSPPGFSPEGASLSLYFNDEGYVTLVTTAGSTVISNDIWGAALLPATTNFVRLTVYQDYAASNQAVLVDDRLAAQDLPFVSTADAYHSLAVLNGSSNAWADDVWVKTTHDALTLTNDANVNGLGDAGELEAFGYAARTHYVGEGPGQPHYDSFETAIGAWRARDTVYAHAGTYTNDVVVTNGITFGAAAFTNSGTLTVAASTVVTFQDVMSWGTVIVGPNAVAVFGSGLACSNLVVAAGSTATFHGVACDSVRVEAGARATFLGELLCATDCALDLGAAVAFSNAVTCGGALTLGTNATLVAAEALTCVTLTAGVGATVTAQAVTCTNLVSEDGAQLTFLGPVACAADVTLGSGAWAGFSNTVTCAGAFTVGPGATLACGQAVTCGDLTLATGSVATFAAVNCANLGVGPGAQASFGGALDCENNSLIESTAVVTFGAPVTCGGTWAVDPGAAVTFGRPATLVTLTVSGSLTLAGGGALAFDSGTVTGVVQVTGAGTVTVTTALAVLNGGRLEFTDSRFVAAGAGVDMTGTFTIDHSLGELAAVAVPFAEDFEVYAPGTRLQDLGFRGWSARDTNVVVQMGVASAGARAARLQDDTAVSNSLATSATHLWTDFHLLPRPGSSRPDLPTNGASFVAFVDTNGWLEVGSDTGWIVCSNLYLNHGVPVPMTTQTWTRVTVFQDFTQQKAAVFLDGKLAREQLPFRDSAVSTYRSLEINNNVGYTYLDGVVIGVALPGGLDGDLDGDSCPDGREIDSLGSVTVRDDWVRGSWFIFQ